MRPQQIGISVVGAILFFGVVIVGATVWLFLTDPQPVASAINEGQYSPLIQELARVIFDALRGLFRYL
jgi:hypothetical protein